MAPRHRDGDAFGLEAVLDDLFLSTIDEAAAARLPAMLAAHSGAASVALWTLDPISGHPRDGMLSDLPQEMTRLYADHYFLLDPWRVPMLAQPVNRPVFGPQVVAEANVARGAFYNEFGSKLGIFHMLGAKVRLGPEPNAPLGALAIHRPQEAEAFDPMAAHRVAEILPHIRRFLQVRDGLRAAKAAVGETVIAAMLHAMPDAALVCDGHARVLHANRAAEAADIDRIIILRGRGDGRALAARAPGETGRLHASIAQAARGGAGATVRLGSHAFALVSTLAAGFAARLGAPAGLVLVVLRRVPAASPDLIGAARAVLGLTQAEAEAACRLASGLSPEAIARQRDVRLSTVRTLLARAMVRAGAANLRQLVALLSVLPRQNHR